MPVEIGLWRISGGLDQIEFSPLDQESRLQDLLDQDISIASPNWMVVGREVQTDWGSRIDILAIDTDGSVIVVELKRDRTPREVVSQVLEYGSWVQALRSDDIARIFNDYVERYHPEWRDISINQRFRDAFGLPEMPEEMNQSHQLVIVSSYLDPITEKIVAYLAGTHGVGINVIFFRVFKDGDREYLTRAWLIDPTLTEVEPPPRPASRSKEWNGEYYVSFGESEHRQWADARKFGFVSAGGGAWYVNTLGNLRPGNRIWVNVPGKGYVGVGEVTCEMARFDKFTVEHVPDGPIPLTQLGAELQATDIFNEGHGEHLVGVRWIKTVGVDQAIKEKGFFGSEHTVARPRADKWNVTIQRLKKHFNIAD